jgi:hypothetical protein
LPLLLCRGSKIILILKNRTFASWFWCGDVEKERSLRDPSEIVQGTSHPDGIANGASHPGEIVKDTSHRASRTGRGEMDKLGWRGERKI